MSLSIWCNRRFLPAAEALLREGTQGHRLLVPEGATEVDIAAAEDAAGLDEADVVFGQPPQAAAHAPRLRWLQVSSAGYDRYDHPGFRDRLRERGIPFTTTSSVFADPCAQHVLAMMLSLNRQLHASYRDQLGDHRWEYRDRRYASDLLTGQTVLMLGYGAIARRLTGLLAPFGCRLYALRRQTHSVPGVHIIAEEDLTRVLPLADHVVDLLPSNERTWHWVNARRLACLKPGARFYNIGRGATVDQAALLEALQSGRLGAAYLDVAETEPLPVHDPLWSAPRCFITPHTAGGRRDQDEAVVQHFLDNLQAFREGRPLACRIV